uniref:Secreted protein n=1 Tax=Ixodes ricinus TaxID=34613 RepID=A0A6B0UTQ2_IXORI
MGVLRWCARKLLAAAFSIDLLAPHASRRCRPGDGAAIRGRREWWRLRRAAGGVRGSQARRAGVGRIFVGPAPSRPGAFSLVLGGPPGGAACVGGRAFRRSGFISCLLYICHYFCSLWEIVFQSLLSLSSLSPSQDSRFFFS